MPTRRVVLWRHGRTEWNVAGRVQGSTDIPLDDVGRRQAAGAAELLATLGPTRILSSDLSRAWETAQALGSLTGVEVEAEPRFQEMHFGAREGLTWREAWEQFPDGMRAWVSGDETQIPDSETHEQAGARFAEGLRAALDERVDDTLVVVAHGGVLRAGACSFMGYPLEMWHSFGGLSNCAWSTLEEASGDDWVHWRITAWNASSLPAPVVSDDE